MKTWPIEYDPQAIDDLEQIHDWIAAKTSVRTADGYEQRVVAFINRLRHFPERGERRDDLTEGLRVIGFEGRVSVAFRVQPDRLVVVRLLYGGRQFDSR